MQVGKIGKPQDEHVFLSSRHLSDIVYFYFGNSWGILQLLRKFLLDVCHVFFPKLKHPEKWPQKPSFC